MLPSLSAPLPVKVTEPPSVTESGDIESILATGAWFGTETVFTEFP